MPAHAPPSPPDNREIQRFRRQGCPDLYVLLHYSPILRTSSYLSISFFPAGVRDMNHGQVFSAKSTRRVAGAFSLTLLFPTMLPGEPGKSLLRILPPHHSATPGCSEFFSRRVNNVSAGTLQDQTVRLPENHLLC